MRRSEFLRNFAAVVALLIAAVALCHTGLESLARWAEAKPGVYLWRNADDLLLLNPSRLRHSGRGRVMIFGASEGAEGFVDETLRRRLPASGVDNFSFDGAVFDDFALQLQYLEAIYGPGAMPSHIVVALTPRFLADIPMENPRSFRQAVEIYSPAQVSGDETPLTVGRKSPANALMSWLKFRRHQDERYAGALRVAMVELVTRLRPGWAAKHDLRSKIVKAKFRTRRPTDKEIRDGLRTAGHWQKTHRWMASAHLAAVARQIAAVNDIARRNHVQVCLVNMPVLPINREMFAAGAYEDYLKTIEAVRGDAAFLDLGELLPVSEFEGTAHASLAGAVHLSTVTAEWIRAHQSGAEALR